MRAFVLMLMLSLVAAAFAASASASSVTVQAREFRSLTAVGQDPALAQFTYLVNVDNARDPQDPNPTNHPGLGGTESNSPVVAVGDETTGAFDLPDGKYLITVRSPDHKMWGTHIVLPRDAGTVNVSLRQYPIPRGKIKVIVFNDNHWTNTALDVGEAGIAGIHVVLFDEFHNPVTVDGLGNPLCGGRCETDSDGFVGINNLHPGLYHVRAIGPKSSGWHQDTTIDGGYYIPIGVEEGADGSSVPANMNLAETNNLPPEKRTVNQIGMFRTQDWTPPATGRGLIVGTAKNDLTWPPAGGSVGEGVDRPYVALSDLSTDGTVYLKRGNRDGTFSIPTVPAGSYILGIWDEQMDYVIRFMQVDVAPGEHVDLGDVAVPRWTAWLEGDVFYDANGDQVKGTDEKPVPNTDVDIRWPNGAIKDATMTDKNGHYQYTQAEGGGLGKWVIGEVGFSRYATTGAIARPDPDYATPHAADFPADQIPIDTTLGGGLLTNQLFAAGHHHVVDWGKKVYGEGETGQIVGVAYHGTTRNEVDARNQGHEDYEPGIPGVVVRLKGLGQDGVPHDNTAFAGQPGYDEDPTLNEYTTDKWAQPKNCELRENFGALVDPNAVNPAITADCLETPVLSGQTLDGKFDGGYAFADMCAPDPIDGSSTFPCNDPVPLKAGKYITQVLMPNDGASPTPHDLYQITKEEDVNVDNGPPFVTPALPQPQCVGDHHTVPPNDLTAGRGKTAGLDRRLCDQRLVVLKNKQNANSDFYLFTSNDIEIPGRVIGLLGSDVYVETDPQSLWYQNKRPEPHVPIGIYDREPTRGGRLIKTIESDENGEYDVMLPSSETANCPTPQGTCPGEYWFVVNDPGTKQHPNANYRGNLSTEGVAAQVWPGLNTQLDTPVIPTSGQACMLPAQTPDLMQVSKPYVRPATNATPTETGAARRITLEGNGFGGNGTVTLTGSSTAQSRTLTSGVAVTDGAGGIVSWTDNAIVIQIPNDATTFFGPKQLLIRNSDSGNTGQTGLTIHVLRTGLYAPTIRNVLTPNTTTNVHALQDAIDGASPGDLVVLAKGTYEENVIIDKPLVLQGSGPGGTSQAGSLDGTSINGAFFPQNIARWTAKKNSTSWSGEGSLTHTLAQGAAITVVAPNTGPRRFNNINLPGPARIDGIGIRTSQGGGAGGVQVNGYARNLRLTNNLIDGNSGQYAGGVAIGAEHGDGTALASDNHSENTVIRYNRVEGNGARARSGAIALFYGADNYDVSHNTICSNYSFEYGGGITHYGRSNSGSIADNKLYYNAAFDAGGAIIVSEQLRSTPGLGTGTGTVDIDRNEIQGNFSGDDGGALYLRSAYGARIRVRGNIMAANASASAGGAMVIADSSNVRIVNNTVAYNATTGTVETRNGDLHSAGLTSDANNPLWQAQQAPGAPKFSEPVALYNNVFTQNTAYRYDQLTNALVDPTLMDFEVAGILTGPVPTLSPRRSVLSVPYGPTSPNPFNLVGLDPLFVTVQPPVFLVQASAANPAFVSVSLTLGLGAGLELALGNYHLTTASGAIDRGVATNNGVAAPTLDLDQDVRPQLRTPGRQATPFDLGADEVPQ